MTDNLLNEGDQPPIDPNKNYLAELVGEGKKFANVEELAKGKFFADQTLKTMEQRQDELRNDFLELREKYTEKANLEELIKQLKEDRASSSHTPEANDNKPALDASQLDTLISKKMEEAESNRKASANYQQVVSKLTEQFGSNYAQVLKQRTEELGLTGEDITALARKSPTAFFKTMGLETKQEGFQTPPRSTQRNDSFAPTSSRPRTWAYYQELKKANPKLYYDPKITVQMSKDAVELGDKFRDGDYFVKGLHEPNL